MNKTEKEKFAKAYAEYCDCYENGIIPLEKLAGVRAVIDIALTDDEILAIENKVHWTKYPAIYNRFLQLDEIVKCHMKTFKFVYELQYLEIIKDEFEFYAESEKQYFAVMHQIEDLICMINNRKKHV